MSFAEIKKAINSNLNKTLDALITEKANSLNTGISDNKAILNNSTYGLSALKTLLTGGKVPVVKSVQRGVSQVGHTSTKGSKSYSDVTISSVNISKSIVLIEPCSMPYNTSTDNNCDNNGGTLSNSDAQFAIGMLTSSTNLRVMAKYYGSTNYSYVIWQVIEFY